LSKPKKEEIPDIKADDLLWKTFNINACPTTVTADIGGLTSNMDISGASVYAPDKDDKIIQLLDKIVTVQGKLFELQIDIWHNQATMIKWLSKIAENTKHTGKCTLED